MRDLNPQFDEEVRAGAIVMDRVEKISRRINETRKRLSKQAYDENILRQFKSALADSDERQLDLVGYKYGE